jgi:hypothetical protein
MIWVSCSLLLRGVFFLQPRFISSGRSPPHDWYECDLVVGHWLTASDFVVPAKTKELMSAHQLSCSRFNRIS